MDTLTHALSGALIGRLYARGDSSGPAALRPLPAMLVGAAAASVPDIDIVARAFGELFYLQHHRGITHSVILAPLWAALLAWCLARLRPQMRHQAGAWRRLYPLVLIGVLVHILGDLITSFGTMILTPFSDTRFGWGWVFIIDLVFSGILAAGLLLSAIFRRSRLPALLATLTLVGWVAVCAQGRNEAIAAGRVWAQAQGLGDAAVDATPRPASPFNWSVIVEDGERYHFAHINTRRSEVLDAGPDAGFITRYSAPYRPVAQAEWQTRERFGDGAQALARTAWARPELAFFRWFAAYPVVDTVRQAGEAGCTAFEDLRFVTPARAARPFRYSLCRSAGDVWQLFAVEGESLRPLR